MKDAGGGRCAPQGIAQPPRDTPCYERRNIETHTATSSLATRHSREKFFVGINFVDYRKVFSESICVKRKTQTAKIPKAEGKEVAETEGRGQSCAETPRA
ncbi:hypothetical protein E2C01_025704 [Portunus trituberculatus]|uniref:Uncharacterized protein n=1 Tax=Portunus trituberculatus TaxID=210409 RepID=A0A5B7EIN3_PORTR|nr:hypothetical protein [Portunus trituberculatus]